MYSIIKSNTNIQRAVSLCHVLKCSSKSSSWWDTTWYGGVRLILLIVSQEETSLYTSSGQLILRSYTWDYLHSVVKTIKIYIHLKNFPSLTDSNSEIEIHYHPGHSDLPPGTVYPGTPSPEKSSLTDIVKIRAGRQNHRFRLCFYSNEFNGNMFRCDVCSKRLLLGIAFVQHSGGVNI